MSKLIIDLREFSPDERRIIELFVDGLKTGHHEYGPLRLDNDPRDFLVEAIQELRDTAVYLTIEVSRLQKERYGKIKNIG